MRRRKATPEERAQLRAAWEDYYRRHPGSRPEPFWPKAVGGALAIAVLLAAFLGWAEWIHGDWRCALAQCRIETK